MSVGLFNEAYPTSTSYVKVQNPVDYRDRPKLCIGRLGRSIDLCASRRQQDRAEEREPEGRTEPDGGEPTELCEEDAHDDHE